MLNFSRSLIDCMMSLIKPQAGELIQDPAAGTGGFLIAADRYIKQRTDDLFTLSEAVTFFLLALMRSVSIQLFDSGSDWGDRAVWNQGVENCLMHPPVKPLCYLESDEMLVVQFQAQQSFQNNQYN